MTWAITFYVAVIFGMCPTSDLCGNICLCRNIFIRDSESILFFQR
ncbi:13090_t:CDS:2 [Gigaspora margarita]|uniref:13090_t:CDS:1 n=1 Tax=Gigaspora margarita TaxID=4874 RepID=A0ABN7UV79_GIGMA|nr:13090_t:CDS:2 [Gigaspora margarita]